MARKQTAKDKATVTLMREKLDFSIDKEIGVIRAGGRDKRCEEQDAHRCMFDEWAMNGRGRMAKATGQFVTWA